MDEVRKKIIMLELNSLFDETKKDCLEVLEKHILKGDSWKTCNVNHLRDKLKEEFNEVRTATTLEDEAYELLDLINIAIMFRKRLCQL